MATLYMETTSVPVIKTVSQIAECLMRSGARSITQQCNAKGQIAGVSFALAAAGAVVPYELPARVDPIYRLLIRKRKGYVSDVIKAAVMEQAERVAWRQVLRWVEAQMAMIQTGMVDPAEVFLPYVINANGKTLYQCCLEGGFKMLAAPVEDALR